MKARSSQDDSCGLNEWVGGVVPFIDTKNIRRKPGCLDEWQGIYFGQNGAWGLRESEILALYLKTDVPALET